MNPVRHNSQRTKRAQPRAAVTLAFGVQGFSFAIVLTQLPDFQSRWHLDELLITAVIFGVALLAGVGSGLAGLMAGRYGSATSLRLAMLMMTVALTITGLATGFALFLVGIGLFGLALGLIDASENMQAVALESDYGRSILTSFHAAWSAGGILGAIVTSVARSADLPLMASVAPLALLPALMIFAPYARHTQPLRKQTIGVELPGSKITGWRGLAPLGLALVLFYVADSAASSWSSLFMAGTLEAAPAIVPLAYGSYQATSLISRVLGDHAVRRLGSTAVMRIAAAVGGAGLLLVVLSPTPWTAIAGFAILGLGLAVVAPLTFSAAGRLSAAGSRTMDDHRRRADALVARLNQFNYVGFVAGGVLTGLVGHASSLRWGFVVPLVGVLLIILLARAFAPVATITPNQVREAP